MTTTTTRPAGAGDRADADALNTAAAYRAATAGAAVYESGAGRLKLTGADARDLLNRLSTNLVDPSAPAGEVTATVLTSDRGRIVDLVYVAHCGDHQLLLTGAGQQDNVTAFLDRYTIMEDIEVEDITGRTALLGLTGPAAGAIVSAAAVGLADDGARVIALPGNPEGEGEGEGADGPPHYRILAPAASGGAALGRLQAAGAVPISAAAAETLRIARGRPQYGAEMGDAYNPLEAGLIGAIDFHKGCYIGQEVIARLDTYRKVQKYLVALHFDADAGVVADLVGARLLDGAGKAMGLVTSAAVLPPDEDGDGGAAGGGAVIGLGYVRTGAAEVGASFSVAPAGGNADGGVAQITARPLLFGGEKPAGNSR